MAVKKTKGSVRRVTHTRGRELWQQIGALCWRRRNKGIQVLLVTSRRSHRWIIPKGWPMVGKTLHQAAAIEAYEEAGVEGKVADRAVGLFGYAKVIGEGSRDLPCAVSVFPLKVKKTHSDFPERRQRRRKWVSQKKALKLVKETELRNIIREFEPDIS